MITLPKVIYYRCNLLYLFSVWVKITWILVDLQLSTQPIWKSKKVFVAESPTQLDKYILISNIHHESLIFLMKNILIS